MKAWIRWFDPDGSGVSLRTEILAGTTTFLTMSYILFVQPAVLSTDFAGNPTGMDPGAVLLATAVSSAVATALMGLWARYPIALAPGMGENFFFVTTVMALGAAGVADAWRTALAVVFLSGLAFVVLSAFRIREAIVDGISPSMSAGISAGIGLFMTFIGLKSAGIITGASGTLVTLNLHLDAAALSVFGAGLAVAAALHARRKRGAILAGILVASAFALALGKMKFGGIVGLPDVKHNAIFEFDFAGALTLKALPFIVVFLFMDMFDTVGTLVGVTGAAGWKQAGKLPRVSQALLSDAVGTVVGATMGTSTVTSYIESATGIQAGGRTGLTALVVAALFLLALLFSPLIAMVAGYPPITAPALVIVGALMMRNTARIAWDDPTEALPAFLVLAGIPLCFSIADGLALGFLAHPVLKLLAGRGREIRWPMAVVAVTMGLYFVFVRSQI
ncbi:MAG: NCS2 family permease [Verrucomicrobia bacterium]|nr:NCS2 family permease [Verrucomicrobiota bacterium]